jgi:hypothetical protein
MNCAENRFRRRLFAVGERYRFDSTYRRSSCRLQKRAACTPLPTFSKDGRELSRAADIYTCNRETTHCFVGLRS